MKYQSEFDNNEMNRIQDEFKRLKDIHYLDHAGATQYSEQQMHKIFTNFTENVYCNPHTSKTTEDLIDQVRYKIVNHFNTTTDEYSVIFTSGATASLKLLAETFDFGSSGNGWFMYLRDNHTSVLGMREIVTTNYIKCIERNDFLNNRFDEIDTDGNSLLVYPAQCNFNGNKYSLEKIEQMQKQNTDNYSNRYVCLDAASFAGTNYLDLDKYHPDFVCISFYKLFGYPTGLGALLVSKRGEMVLKKKYYGGGTVKISFSDQSGWHQKRDCLHERLEDGTIPYLSIISLLSGYDTLERLIPGKTFNRISQHCFNLCKYLYEALKTLKYSNGQEVIHYYHDSDFSTINDQGGIVNFNVLHENGSYVGFTEVAYMAQLHNIYLRTGCFCNPGACQRHLGLSNDNLMTHFHAGHICGDGNDLINGVPTGSVRVSVGYMTTKENADALIKMITNCYSNKNRNKLLNSQEICSNYKLHKLRDASQEHKPLSLEIGTDVNERSKKKFQLKHHLTNLQIDSNKKERIRSATLSTECIKLREICVFPVKSCAPFRIDTSWPLTLRGLKYDREWMIVRSNGVAMTQKSDTKLCLIQPSIDETQNTLELSFPYAKSIQIPLRMDLEDNKIRSSFCQSKVCGDRIDGIDCGDDVAEWLSYVLCTSGLRLIQQNITDKRTMKNSVMKADSSEQAISLSNQAQFLLINIASVDWLAKKVNDWSEMDECNEKILQNMIDRFRGNLIIESTVPLEELNWQSIQFGDVQLHVTGPCTRCQMICIDQSTGDKTTEPLQTISREFQGKMRFGIYLSQISGVHLNTERIICCDRKIIVQK